MSGREIIMSGEGWGYEVIISKPEIIIIPDSEIIMSGGEIIMSGGGGGTEWKGGGEVVVLVRPSVHRGAASLSVCVCCGPRVQRQNGTTALRIRA